LKKNKKTHQFPGEKNKTKNKDRCLKLSYIMGLGKTTGGKNIYHWKYNNTKSYICKHFFAKFIKRLYMLNFA